MATGREYLKSIIMQASDMAAWSDEDLEVVKAELAHVDDRMPSDRSAVEQWQAEAQQAAAETEAVVTQLRPRSFAERGADEARAHRKRASKGGGLIHDGGVWP